MFSHLVLPVAAALLLSTGVAFAEDAGSSAPPAAAKEAVKDRGPMKDIDKDGDGQVSSAESEAFSKEQFSKIDTNEDGSLSQGELKAFHQERRKGRPDGEGGEVPEEMKEKMKARMEEERKGHEAMMDKDGDGVVSEEEFLSHARERQSRMDVNGDGNVTREEVMEVREKRRAAHEKRREELKGKARGGHDDWQKPSVE
ncbi:MAG: EF-hand domain-containing protein [Micavibrio aeruginosavorus]|uniref:EF-hand domain-containing protein n=1 Tax=Micavibrio aeruginosavorus TaxID=349221 RepID=A0A7T5R3T9_9BACT|nr:MAG: EF-hand domain-containing protein [Micavibrio aeruginosavorus]